MHAWAAVTFGAVFWLGAIGATLLAARGRVRLAGAGVVALGALVTFAWLASGVYSAVKHFGPETDEAALSVLASAAAGLAGILAFTALLGLLPDKVERIRPPGIRSILGTSAVVVLSGAVAWFGTAAFCVQQALGPLSTVQWMQCWGPAAGALALWLPAAARAPRAGLAGLLVATVVGGSRLTPDPLAFASSIDAESVASLAAAGDPGTRLLKAALLVEVPVAGPWRGPAGRFVVGPGRDAIPGADAKATARQARREQVVPGFAVPVVKERPQRVEGFLVAGGHATPLGRGWSQGPDLTADAIRESLRQGAAFLTRNQQAGGRFTYIVKGDGQAGAGYNYPRHAGTAWFLAREAVALGDITGETTARRALQHLDEVSGHTPDGRAFILDPARSDGKAWIGTTALTVLAVSTLDDIGPWPSKRGWKQQVIASVDANGKVRGEMTVADGKFIDGDANGYGQGQAMLALAAIARAPKPSSPHADPEDPVLRTAAISALQRASVYVGSSSYYGAHPLWVGDEHWMCLAAHAIHTANARSVLHDLPLIDPSGPDAVCQTYATMLALAAPRPGAGLPPSAGPAAGGAEAVIARAWDTASALSGTSPASFTTTTLGSASLDYGRLFLNSQYRTEDGPLTTGFPNLLGGYRDGPYDLDVQIDTVQHIGGALLGVLALIEGEDGPGRLP